MRRLDIAMGTVIPSCPRDGDNMIDLSGKVAPANGVANRTISEQSREAGAKAFCAAHATAQNGATPHCERLELEQRIRVGHPWWLHGQEQPKTASPTNLRRRT
jgi:hypothetical protein